MLDEADQAGLVIFDDEVAALRIKKHARQKRDVGRPKCEPLDGRPPPQRTRELLHLPAIAEPLVGQDLVEDHPTLRLLPRPGRL